MSATDIKPEIRNLADQLKSEMNVGDAGIAEVPKEAYEKSLGDGLTMDIIKQVQQHNADFVAATGLALGEVGMAAMKKNKELDQVSIEIPVHKDSVAGVFARSKQVPDGNGGMQAKHGVLSMRYTTSGAAGSKGSLKKVRQHLADEAKAALAD